MYEFVTPSDKIVFNAENNAIALYCAVVLGNGKACCERSDGEKIPSMLMFVKDAELLLKEYLGDNIETFGTINALQVAAAFRSFCYGTFASRKEFDLALAAITDPKKKKKFLAAHDNIRRTSMSEWVTHAWKLADVYEAEAKKHCGGVAT
jgi:hypothetical protein